MCGERRDVCVCVCVERGKICARKVPALTLIWASLLLDVCVER